MKKIISFLTLILINSAVLSAQDSVAVKKHIDSSRVMGIKGEGIVSFKYKTSGCGTVVLVPNKDKKDTAVLIPMATAWGNNEVDGLKITFRYFHLMIRNPKGCMHGGPVRMWDIERVKKRHHTKKKTAQKTK